MSKDLFLPKGFELPDGQRIGLLLFSGSDWQIFRTSRDRNCLVARAALAQKWFDLGFVGEAQLRTVVFGDLTLRVLSSPDQYGLIPVESDRSPTSKIDALSFAVALKESRRISAECSLHDAIYLEQFSRLLPTWTLTPRVEDKVVLGKWITGGVVISIDAFRRLCKLAGWMNPLDLSEIIRVAGFEPPLSQETPGGKGSGPQGEEDGKSAPESQRAQQGERGAKSVETGKEYLRLPGRPALEAFFNEHVVDIVLNPERYRRLGIEFPPAIVLHGPPGCGKTFAVERLVEHLDWPNFSIDSSSVGSPYIHETSKKISALFDKAIENAPSVLVIDEMESFLTDRSTGASPGLHHVEEVAEFLRRIPEASKSRVLVIAMTNLINLIDPAILRRGRFDHVIEVGMPSRAEVKSLLDELLSKLPLSTDVKVESCLDVLVGRPLSDSAFLVREAARIAARASKVAIDQTSLIAAAASIPDVSSKPAKRIGFVRED